MGLDNKLPKFGQQGGIEPSTTMPMIPGQWCPNKKMPSPRLHTGLEKKNALINVLTDIFIQKDIVT